MKKSTGIILSITLAICCNGLAGTSDKDQPNILMIIVDELYDYKNDPLETINLAKSPDHAKVLQRLIDQAADFANAHMEISWNL